MKWFAGLVALVFLALLLLVATVLGTISTASGASWVLGQFLRATVDSRIEVRGPTKVDVWPLLAVRSTDIVLPADLPGQDVSACVSRGSSDAPDWVVLRSLELIADWRDLVSGHVHVPYVLLDGLTLRSGIVARLGADDPDSPGDRSGVDLMSDVIGRWLPGGWRMQLDELVAQTVAIVGCPSDSEATVDASVRRVTLQLDVTRNSDRNISLPESLTGSLTFAVDDLVVSADWFDPQIGRWLDMNGYVAQNRLRAETVRATWRLAAGQASMESLLLVGPGPGIEFVSGSFDLLRARMALSLMLQSPGGVPSLNIPGAQIKLRQTRLPVLIEGDWSSPRIVLGERTK